MAHEWGGDNKEKKKKWNRAGRKRIGREGNRRDTREMGEGREKGGGFRADGEKGGTSSIRWSEGKRGGPAY